MAKKPPPKKGNCPKGGDHATVKISEKDGWLVHKCRKCGQVFERWREPMQGLRRAAAVLLAAAAIFGAGAFKGCTPGQHAAPTLPVHTQNWWLINLPPQDYVVFGRGKPPAGQWEQVGWVRRPPGLPRVRVWVQR